MPVPPTAYRLANISMPLRARLGSMMRHQRSAVKLFNAKSQSDFVARFDQLIRVICCTQFVSHVLPPSGESACSQRADVRLILDQMKRERTRFPLTVSSP